MNEKIFKTIRGTGAASLAVGIVVLVTGISAGVMMIVNGARLLKCKSQACQWVCQWRIICVRNCAVKC